MISEKSKQLNKKDLHSLFEWKMRRLCFESYDLREKKEKVFVTILHDNVSTCHNAALRCGSFRFGFYCFWFFRAATEATFWL